MTIPATMQAAILVEQRAPLQVDKIDLPQTLAIGQVLVEIHYSGICGSQLGEIDGAKGPDRFLPHLLGHEASGIVAAIGPGVARVKVGDKVVLHWRKGQGIEAAPPSYGWRGGAVNAGWVTTFNEYTIASENRLTSIPDNSEMDVAALFGCAVTTGFGVIVNNAQVKIGESVVVFGAGGVGLNIVQAAALSAAYPIIAVDLYDNRLELARDMGATHLVNAAKQGAREAILAAVGPSGPDLFIDNTGKPEIIQLGYDITKPAGRVVLVGVPRKEQPISIYSLPMHFGKKITGSHGGETVPQEDIPRYHNLYSAGRIKLRPLISRIFPLSEINEAIAVMRNGSVSGRCMIKIR